MAIVTVISLKDEASCEALGLERHEYLLHLLFQRSLELREKGPGFDAPSTGKGSC